MLVVLRFRDESSLRWKLASLHEAKRFDFLVSNFSIVCWYIILRSHEEFIYCGLKHLLCVACKVFLIVVCKCSCSSRISRGVLQELHKVFSEVFLVCGQFGLY